MSGCGKLFGLDPVQVTKPHRHTGGPRSTITKWLWETDESLET